MSLITEEPAQMETITERKSEDSFLSRVLWILLAILLTLFLAKIFITNQLATTGVVSSSRSEILQALKAQNQRLQNEVSLLGSINSINEKATKIGLTSITKVSVLPQGGSVALNR